MRDRSRLRALWLAWLLLVAQAALPPDSLGPVGPPRQAAASQQTAELVSARTWIGREAEIESYLASAGIERIEEIGVGVTAPRRVFFVEGGPIASAAWKPIRPGRYKGFWESYKAEIAAYELDKLLGLQMVPVTIERRIEGDRGALIQWVAPTRMWKEAQHDPRPDVVGWDRQVIRMRMLDNLICNTDRNLGNLLVDPAWNLILIDHSRAFTTSHDLPARMNRVDRELWNRMLALDEATVTGRLGRWLSRREIRAILERRDKMRDAIAALVAALGEAAVFVP